MSKKRNNNDQSSFRAQYPNSLSQPRSTREMMSTEVLDGESLQLCLSPPAVRAKLFMDEQHTALNTHTATATAVAIEQPEVEEIPHVNLDYLLPLPLAPSFCLSHFPAGASNGAVATPASSSVGIRQEKPVRARWKSGATFAGKDDFVPEPFPWATNRRAHIYSLRQLLENGIHAITGEVQCKRCKAQYEIEYPLRRKFEEIQDYIARNKATMHDRAPTEWMNPTLRSCLKCQYPLCVKPVISKKKRSINWLFLLLGRMLGCCNLEQLKYFCKHTNNHRTGAKDRVLYLTYLGICKQLAGPDHKGELFNR
ncbi:uncharacterized protein [Aristolochia californica]|uniref:uncharacterized protein n=1 Tax=Aristolochia californica TaxID=171875 RepID=UPI0035D63A10